MKLHFLALSALVLSPALAFAQPKPAPAPEKGVLPAPGPVCEVSPGDKVSCEKGEMMYLRARRDPLMDVAEYCDLRYNVVSTTTINPGSTSYPNVVCVKR